MFCLGYLSEVSLDTCITTPKSQRHRLIFVVDREDRELMFSFCLKVLCSVHIADAKRREYYCLHRVGIGGVNWWL